MQFYNLKTRSHVDVPMSDIKKQMMKRQTKSGEQIRYALVAEYGGTKLFKFVKKADYDAANVPEAK